MPASNLIFDYFFRQLLDEKLYLAQIRNFPRSAFAITSEGMCKCEEIQTLLGNAFNLYFDMTGCFDTQVSGNHSGIAIKRVVLS